MGKIIKFRKSLNQSFDKANDKCDEGDYLFALSSLLNEMERHPDNADVCAHVADIYTELGLYENAILTWFKYLLRAKKEDYWEAYNGLGANYYFLEENYLASYYFSEQLKITEEVCGVYAEVLEDFLDNFGEDKNQTFKLVKEKTKEEKKQEFLDKIHKLCNEGKEDDALKILQEIKKGDYLYGESLVEQALIYLKNDEIVKALDYIKLSFNENCVSLLSLSLAIDLSKALKTDEETVYLKMLEEYSAVDDEEKYKKMTALYENGLEDSAREIAVELLKDDRFDANTSYVLGFLLFNKGDLKGAEKCFKTAYLLSGNYTSLYYLRHVQKVIDKKENCQNINVDFSVPKTESNRQVDLLNSLVEAESLSNEYPLSVMKDLIDWCVSNKDDRATFPTCWAFIQSGRGDLFELVKEVLVNPTVSDVVKQSVVSVICADTKVKSIKLVVDGVFKIITFNRPDFSVENKELFEKAYAKASGKVYVFKNDNKCLLSIGAKELQRELIATGNVNAVSDVSALSCAMYVYSGLNIFKNNNFYEFFGTTKSKVVEIIKLTEIDNEN